MPAAFNGVTILPLANASWDQLDNTSNRRHFQDDQCHLDMELPAAVGGTSKRLWIEPAGIWHQDGMREGMFPIGQPPLDQREASDNAGKQAIRSER